MDKALLDIKETSAYLSVGMTQTRQLKRSLFLW